LAGLAALGPGIKPGMDAAWQAPLMQHIADHVGPVVGVIDVPTPSGPMGLLHVPPTDDKPFHVLVTAGMSAAPMPVPEDVEAPAHAELLLALPPPWPVEEGAFQDPQAAWPMRVLASIAALPRAYGAWLGAGHTVPNGSPPEPFVPGLDFCGVLVAPPMILAPAHRTFTRPDGAVVALYALLPVFEREMELKLEQGTGALLARFDAKGINDLLEVRRASVAGVLIELLER
jgi:hypothetical protein